MNTWGKKWDRNNIVINNIFAFQVAFNIIKNNEDFEPQMWKMLT